MKAPKAHDGYARPVQYSTVRLIVTTQLIVYPFNMEGIYETLVLLHLETNTPLRNTHHVETVKFS